MTKRKANLTKLIQLWGVILLIGIGGSIIVVDLIRSYRDFNARAEEMRADYTARQKEIIKREVERVVDMIHYERSQSEALTKRTLKSRVDEAYAIAQNVYQQNRTSRDAHEIQKMIIDALSPIRFEQGTGYYYIIGLDGVAILFPGAPELEGVNITDTQDTNGQYATKDMIDIAERSGEGFYQYHFSKPDADGDDFEKISFIKKLGLYDWVVGAGLYRDDVEDQIKKDLLSEISMIRFETEGYIFINRFNGDALVSNGKLFSGDKKLWEVFDDNPDEMKNIFEMEQKAALAPDGDYIYYSHIKLTDPTQTSPKASFILGIPEWQWLVGAGLYLDDVELAIASLHADLNGQIKAKMVYFILITACVVFFFFMLFSRMNQRLKTDFNLFISFFSRAALSEEPIDRTQVQFEELDLMAGNANKMLADRRTAEEALRMSEAKFRGLVESSSDWIWEVSATGAYTYVSPQIEKILGYKPEEIIGKSPFDLMPKEEAVRVAEVFNGCVLERKPIVALENINLHKKGQHVVLETSGNPVFNEQGDLTGYQGVDRDITRLKRYEKTIAESEKKFRNLFDMLPLPIAVTEVATGRFVDVNAKLCDISKFKKKELIGKSATEIGFFSSLDREKFISALKESDEIKDFEMDFKGKDGSILKTLMFSKIIEFETKHYIITAVYDRTDRDRLESQQRKIRQLESIATLSGGIAHEFNNALSVVLGHVELLQIELADHENVRTFGQQALESIEKLTELTKHLHAYARGGKYLAESLNVSDFIGKKLPNMLSDKHPDITVDMDLPGGISNINADAKQLQLVIDAVLKNALEAIDGPGRIHIATGEKEVDEEFAAINQGIKPGRYVTITIEDTGKGMDEKTRDRIFDPFFTTKFQGRGLGMAAVYGIIKNHGGYVYINSELGKGTKVRMLIPPEIENTGIQP